MKFDFYYGEESEQYSFYSVPKIFFKNDIFNDLSAMAKLMYSFLLDRMSLSYKRNWIDDKNRAYIKYSLKAICNDMCVSKNSVIKYMRELQNFGLIVKYPSKGMEDIIYVMDFSKIKRNEEKTYYKSDASEKASEMMTDEYMQDKYAPPNFNKSIELTNKADELKNDIKIVKSNYREKCTDKGGSNIEPVRNMNQFKTCTGTKNELVQNLNHHDQKDNNLMFEVNKNIFTPENNIINTNKDLYKSYPSINHNSYQYAENDETDRIDDTYEYICKHVKDNIDYDVMMARPECSSWYEDYYNLIVEILMRKSKTVKISGEEYSMQLVRKRFEMLNSSHLQYIHMQINKSASDIRNIKAYLIKALFNAPVTMNSFYTAKVNYDMANNKF
jgi:hypothetical protein